MKEPLVSSRQGYCSTNLLTQEVSQHIALYDAQLHGTFRDSSLRVPVQGDRRERCAARFPKFLSGLNEPVQLFLAFILLCQLLDHLRENPVLHLMDAGL